MIVNICNDKYNFIGVSNFGIKLVSDKLIENGVTDLTRECEVSENYGIRNKHNYRDLKKSIDDYNGVFSVKIDIKRLGEYIFKITFNGKLGDILGLISILDIPNRFFSLEYHLNNDINLIKHCMGSSGRRDTYDYNSCLILQLLCDFHSHDSKNFIHDQMMGLSTSMRTDLAKKAFETIYGDKIEDMDEKEEHNPMSKYSIDDKKLQDIKRTIKKCLNKKVEIHV